jgi:quercetin dioxygenase-like cupin family protein
MRVISAIALLSLSAAVAPASAQVAPESANTQVVAGDSRAPVAMAAWKKDGELQSASGDAATKAPRKAVRYDAKMVAWPTATVKVLTFTSKGGGVLHPITDEKTVYVLSGSVDATVDGKAVTLATGDVASLPTGALTNPGKQGRRCRRRRLDRIQPDPRCRARRDACGRRAGEQVRPADHTALPVPR